MYWQTDEFDGATEYVRADIHAALIEEKDAALMSGIALIKGDAIGCEWETGCAQFIKRARAALGAAS